MSLPSRADVGHVPMGGPIRMAQRLEGPMDLTRWSSIRDDFALRKYLEMLGDILVVTVLETDRRRREPVCVTGILWVEVKKATHK